MIPWNSVPQRRRRLRIRWILAFVVVTGATAVGGYVLFDHQRDRNTDRLLRTALEAVDDQEWSAAVNAFRQYLRRRPSDSGALSAYAELALKRINDAPDLLGDVVRTLQRLTQLHPADPDPVRKLALLYLDLNEFASAEGISSTWLLLAPDSPDAAISRARALHGLQRNEDSVEVLIQALERMPAEARFYPPLVDLLEETLKRPAEADRWVSQGLHLIPDAYPVRLAAFSLHRSRGELQQAEAHLNHALTVAPDEPDVMARAAAFFVAQQRLVEAGRILDRADAWGLVDRRLLSIRAAWATETRDADQLASTADRMMEFAKDIDLDLIAQAAELYLRSGKLDGVDRCIEKLAAAPYGKSQAALYLDGLSGARALFEGEAYAAIPRLERVLRKQPSSRWAMELLALAYYNTGALDEATDVYRRIVVLTPSANSARLSLARLALGAGLCRDALQQLDVIIEPSPAETKQAELIRIACALRQPNSQSPEIAQRLSNSSGEIADDAVTSQLFARCLVLDGNPARAVEWMRTWTSANPLRVDATNEFNYFLLAQGHLSLAESWAAELAERFPNSLEGHDLLVRALALTGRLAEASDRVRQAPVSNHGKAELLSLVARAYGDAGLKDDALSALRAAAALDPSNVSIHRDIVRNAESAEEAHAAVEEIRRIEGEGGVHADYERAWWLLNSAGDANDAGEAVSLLKKALSARPGWVSARLLLGYAQELAGQFAEAVDSYRTAHAQRPELAFEPSAIRFIEALKKLGRYEEADKALERLASVSADAPEVLRLQVDQQIRNRNLATAATTAERLLQFSENDPAWAAFTADLKLLAGRAPEAEEIARTALERNPDSASLLWSAVRALVAQNRAAEAETLVRRTVEEQAGAAPCLILAQLLLQLERPDEAERAVEQALAREPDSASIHRSAADFWGARGNRARQLSTARRAVVLSGEAEDRSLALAALLAAASPSAEELAEAHRIIDQRLADHPRDVPALLLRAHLLTVARPARLDEAEKLVNDIISLDPRSVQAYKILGAILARSGRVKAAGDAIASALVFAPNDPDLLLTQAELSSNRGEYGYAITSLKRLLEIRPRLPEALELLAQAYLQTGRAVQGIKELEALLGEGRRAPAELVLLARLYESKREPAAADGLFQQAIESAQTGTPLQEYMRFLARQARFEDIASAEQTHRSKFPADIDASLLAAELLACQADQSELRRRGGDRLLEISATHPHRAADATFRLGVCLYQRGDLINAETMFLKAANLAPKASRPANALAWLYSEELGQPARAIELLDVFLQEGGEADAEMLDTYAAAALRLGRLDVARRSAMQSIALAGQTPTIAAANYRLGLVQIQSGKTSDGRANLRHALDLDRRLGGLNDRERQEAARLTQPEQAGERIEEG